MSTTPTQSIDERAKRGATWAMLGFGGAQLLRFGGNLVLTRLLAPEAFGVMALINATLMGLVLFSDVGLGPSIVLDKRALDANFRNTAWTIQAGRGLLLFILCCAAASPMARLYAHPELAWLIPTAGLSTLVGGLTSIQVLRATREMWMRELTLVEIGSQAVGVGVTLGWAWHNASIAALLAGVVAGAVARVVLSHLCFDGPHGRLAWAPDEAARILRLGRWIFISTALTFLAGQLDRFIFGLWFDFALLGIHNLAVQLASIPSSALGHLGGYVLFPYLTRLFASGGDARSAFLAARRPMLIVGGWAVSGLLAGGPTLVALLYPEPFGLVGVMLPLVALGLWFGVVLEGTNGAALLAQGKAHWSAAGSFGKLVGMAIFMPAGMAAAEQVSSEPTSQFLGALCGVAAAEVMRYGVSLFGVARAGLAHPGEDARLSVGVLAAGALGYTTARLISQLELTQSFGGAGVTESVAARLAAACEGVAIAVVVSAVWSPWLWSIFKGSRRSLETPG